MLVDVADNANTIGNLHHLMVRARPVNDFPFGFVATDMPHADKFTVGIMALLAEKEADMISQRTRDGLAAARRRGIRLGNPHPAQALKVAQTANLARADAYAKSLLPVIKEIRAAHVTTLRKLAQCLNARGFKTPNGKAFKAQSVKNLVERAFSGTAATNSDARKHEHNETRAEVSKPKRLNPTSAIKRLMRLVPGPALSAS
jgi:Resolvase, N terminal domain/Recombinase